jgi:hypothetical protein
VTEASLELAGRSILRTGARVRLREVLARGGSC